MARKLHGDGAHVVVGDEERAEERVQELSEERLPTEPPRSGAVAQLCDRAPASVGWSITVMVRFSVFLTPNTAPPSRRHARALRRSPDPDQGRA